MTILKSSLFFLATLCVAQPATSLSDDDRSAIQTLMGQYSQALSGCKAADFADLFLPDGVFASGFRGRMAGRARLIALVESERQCVAPPTNAKAAARPGGAAGPTVVLTVTASGVHGVASVTGAEYQDDYAKTPQGWRFASRAVLTAGEKAAGLDAAALVAIERISGAAKLSDHYEPDQNGVARLMTSGVKVGVAGGQVTGRAYLKDGSYDDAVYEKIGSEWRVKSSTHVAAAAK